MKSGWKMLPILHQLTYDWSENEEEAFESDRFVKRIVIVLNGVEKSLLRELIATKSFKDRFE